MITIITTHPWERSFNIAITKAIETKLKNKNEKYTHINLSKDKFNPNYNEHELSLYSKGIVEDELVIKYQNILKETTELIIIFPIWWGTMPAILKGFFDKVMSLNFAFNYDNGWNPLLTHIKKSTVITTSESPTDMFRNSIENCMFKQMLESVGSKNNIWYNCDRITKSEREVKTVFLQNILENI